METEKSTIQHVHFSEVAQEKDSQGHGLHGWMVSARPASRHVELFGWGGCCTSLNALLRSNSCNTHVTSHMKKPRAELGYVTVGKHSEKNRTHNRKLLLKSPTELSSYLLFN